MRIGSISQISQLYQMNTTAKKNTKTTGSQLDAISISSAGKDYQVAKSALSKISDVRQDRVEQLKKQISDGSYDVSAEDFASHLLKAYEKRTI